MNFHIWVVVAIMAIFTVGWFGSQQISEIKAARRQKIQEEHLRLLERTLDRFLQIALAPELLDEVLANYEPCAKKASSQADWSRDGF